MRSVARRERRFLRAGRRRAADHFDTIDGSGVKANCGWPQAHLPFSSARTSGRHQTSSSRSYIGVYLRVPDHGRRARYRNGLR